MLSCLSTPMETGPSAHSGCPFDGIDFFWLHWAVGGDSLQAEIHLFKNSNRLEAFNQKKQHNIVFQSGLKLFLPVLSCT